MIKWISVLNIFTNIKFNYHNRILAFRSFIVLQENLEDYKILSENLTVPILANITEFGLTPLYTDQELSEVGVDMILHPLSAFRAMSKAAQEIYEELSHKGTVEKKLKKMQSRDELYDVLNYHSYEEKIDNLFSKE